MNILLKKTKLTSKKRSCTCRIVAVGLSPTLDYICGSVFFIHGVGPQALTNRTTHGATSAAMSEPMSSRYSKTAEDHFAWGVQADCLIAKVDGPG